MIELNFAISNKFAKTSTSSGENTHEEKHWKIPEKNPTALLTMPIISTNNLRCQSDLTDIVKIII